MTDTIQTRFYHFSNCFLSDISRIEHDMLERGKKVLLVVARRQNGR